MGKTNTVATHAAHSTFSPKVTVNKLEFLCNKKFPNAALNSSFFETGAMLTPTKS